MITFVAPTRPFTGVFDQIQRTAIASWRGCLEDTRIVLLNDDIPADVDCDWTHDPDRNAYGTMTLRGVWHIAAKQPTEWVCVIESDIVMSAEIAGVIDAIAHVERPFVVAQRWDMEPGAPRETVKLHPPSAISFCLLRTATIQHEDIPPFAIGRTVHDNWLVYAAIERWRMTVIDATANLTVIHLNHPYPEYGDKQKMLQSEERAKNIRMAQESGCPRWYGIQDAPHALINGKLRQKAAV